MKWTTALWMLGFFAALSSMATAGTGAITPGGKFAVRTQEDLVMMTDLDSFEEKELPLPKGFLVPWARLAATDRELLVGNSYRAMAWNPATGKWRQLFRVEWGEELIDLAVDPHSGMLLAVVKRKGASEAGWRVWDPIARQLVGVFNRRAPEPLHPVFDAEGNLYFTCMGDVWKGSIDFAPGYQHPYVLTATRLWPLAEMETYEGNTAGVSAKEILPLKKFLIVDRSRTNGSGWGSIVKIPNEDPFAKHLPLDWEELDGCDSWASSALSRDGKRGLIYVHSDHRWWEYDEEEEDLEPLPNHPVK